jgi:outer membrane lipoprotein-sorting protein
MEKRMKPWLFCLILPFVFSAPAYAQEIITAERYLESVSERYAGIRDYEARILIRSGRSEMAGNLSYLSPHFMRIDFSRPAEQVIMFNGDNLTVYLPEFRATLSQSINRRSGSSGASLASAQGLVLLRRNYVPAYVSGPEPVALDAGSQERVVQLRLTRRFVSEGFREIILSIDPATRLIRRIEGRTIADVLVQFDFSNIRTNVGVPEIRFDYVAPSSANIYNNFLFREVD